VSFFAAPVVYAAVPTMFGPDGELDLDANRALYKLADGQLDGMLVAGTTGEFPALDDAERLTLIELALAQAGPDRVIAHIGAPDAWHAARLARAAVARGATRLAAITPYYLAARPDELIAHYRLIRDAAGPAELYGYIFPERTGLRVPPALFGRLAEAADLAGVKASGSAAAELAGYVAAAPGRAIFSGDDANPGATMAAGGAGVISGRSSAYPEVYAAMRASSAPLAAAAAGAAAALSVSGAVGAAAAQERLDQIVALGASIGRIKYALQMRGIGTGVARMTVDAPDPETAAAIAEQVAACQPA